MFAWLNSDERGDSSPASPALSAAVVKGRSSAGAHASESVGGNPIGHPGLIRMAGEWAGYYRIRIGDLRVIFWYEIEDDIVYVDHIGPRGDVYR